MPESVQFVPFDEERFTAWWAESSSRLRRELEAKGTAREQAEAQADRELRGLLPAGLSTEGAHLWSIRSAGRDIGFAWAHINAFSSGREAYMRDFRLDRDVRDDFGATALAALEAALRSLGSDWVRLYVAAGSVPTFEARGYTRTMTTMSKPLAGTPRPDYGETHDIRLEQMTQDQFDDYRATAGRRNAANTARAGVLPTDEAERASDSDFARLLPDGVNTRGHMLLTAYEGEKEIGSAWFELRKRPDGVHVFGNDILVREDLRGSGYGRSMIRAAMEYFRERNVVSVSGRVLGFNERTKSLLERLGLKDTSVQMKKVL